MTTCIALYDWENTYIWSDGLITNSTRIVKEDSVKFLQYSDYTIGCSGSVIVSQIIRLWHQEIPIQSEEQVFSLKEILINLMKENKCNSILKDADLIIATKFGIYHYYWEDESFIKKEKYICIGSGWNFAYWHIHAIEDIFQWDFKKVIEKYGWKELIENAILLASRFDTGTNNTITSISL